MTTEATDWEGLLGRESFPPEELDALKERLLQEEASNKRRREMLEKETQRLVSEKARVQTHIVKAREYLQLYAKRVEEFDSLTTMNKHLEVEKASLQEKSEKRPLPHIIYNGGEMPMEAKEFHLFLSTSLEDEEGGKPQVWVEQFIPRDLLREPSPSFSVALCDKK